MFGKGRKKPEDPPEANAPEALAPSRLKELCGPNFEMYTAMSRLLLLDPGKITSPLDNVLLEAQDYESKGNKLKAEVQYRIAGGLSLWKGDSDGVRRYFTKASTLTGTAHPEYTLIAQRADEAVSIARKFYEVPSMPSMPTKE